MPQQPQSDAGANAGHTPGRRPGSVRVAALPGERPRRPAVLRFVAIAVAVALGSGGALLVTRLTGAGTGARVGTPPVALDARSIAASGAPAPAAGVLAPDQGRVVVGSTRLVPLGPESVLDTRGSGVAAGTEVELPLPGLPAGSTAALLAVSALRAAQPGAVVIKSSVGEVTALRLPARGAQTSTTTLVPVTGDEPLRIRTEAGGQLLVQLVGAFQPVAKSADGRLVPVPAEQVLRLVPKADGKDAVIRLGGVPAFRRAGSVSAVLLQVAADVGPRGGFVRVGAGGRDQAQELFWAATRGADRTRGGLLVVPVSTGEVTVHYEAGTELRADLVGYVTGDGAAEQVAGLTVPLPPDEPAADRLTPVGAGRTAEVTVVASDNIGGVPLDRVGGALIRLTAEGGDITVHAKGARAGRNPTLVSAAGVRRATPTLVSVANGVVAASSRKGAGVGASPQAVILTQ